jgi:hypothetical protein
MTIESIKAAPITDDTVDRAARAILQRKYPMTRAEDMWLDPVVVKDARIALEAALSHSPVEQEPGTPTDFDALASELDIDWVAGLFGSRYGSGAEFLADVAKQLSPAPIAHTFHIDPVSRESVRDEVEGSDFGTWAKRWHQTCETICVLLGVNGSGSPEEILAELQAKFATPAQAKRLQTALGHEGVYIHDATAERAIRASLAAEVTDNKEMPNSAGSQIRTTQRCGMDVGSSDRTSPVAPPSTNSEANRLCDLLDNTFNLPRDVKKSCAALRAALAAEGQAE